MNKQADKRQIITIQSKLSNCSKLSEFLSEYIKSNNIPDEIYNDLRLVVEEAFVNIASYAYSNDGPNTVVIELSNTIDSLSITFTDSGIAFDPLVDCNTNIETDDHCEGSMGIHIIKSLTDHQEYKRDQQHNVFTVTKHYTS